MRNVTLITRRELQAYLRTMSGYIIIAVMLFIDGLLFNAFAVPGTAKKSSEVLADFFTLTSGITMVGAVFLSMRLIAEERQTGTIALLYSSPIHDVEIVLGKRLGPGAPEFASYDGVIVATGASPAALPDGTAIAVPRFRAEEVLGKA